MTRPAIPPLYMDEDECARFVLGARAKAWPDLRRQLERRGLPGIDPVMGGRYRPAVEAFFNAQNGIASGATDGRRPVRNVPWEPDGVEDFSAETPRALDRRRRAGRA